MSYAWGRGGVSRAMVVAFALVAARPAAAVEVETARALVRSAATDTVAAFAGKTLAPDEARAGLRRLLSRYGDMETESRFVLGRYWSRAASEDQQEFARLFERFVISSFGGMIAEVPAGLRFEVLDGEVRGNTVVVHSIATSPGEEASKVEWAVTETASGRPVIVDLSVDGVTLVTTLKADFTSIIRLASGRLEALFDPLRRKVSALGGATDN